jgi:hypothetical protein
MTGTPCAHVNPGIATEAKKNAVNRTMRSFMVSPHCIGVTRVAFDGLNVMKLAALLAPVRALMLRRLKKPAVVDRPMRTWFHCPMLLIRAELF